VVEEGSLKLIEVPPPAREPSILNASEGSRSLAVNIECMVYDCQCQLCKCYHECLHMLTLHLLGALC